MEFSTAETDAVNTAISGPVRLVQGSLAVSTSIPLCGQRNATVEPAIGEALWDYQLQVSRYDPKSRRV